MFDERCFEMNDVIIGMSELHRNYIAERYGRAILLFNEAAGIGGGASVTIGAPDGEHFEAEMRALAERIADAVPTLIHQLGA